MVSDTPAQVQEEPPVEDDRQESPAVGVGRRGARRRARPEPVASPATRKKAATSKTVTWDDAPAAEAVPARATRARSQSTVTEEAPKGRRASRKTATQQEEKGKNSMIASIKPICLRILLDLSPDSNFVCDQPLSLTRKLLRLHQLRKKNHQWRKRRRMLGKTGTTRNRLPFAWGGAVPAGAHGSSLRLRGKGPEQARPRQRRRPWRPCRLGPLVALGARRWWFRWPRKPCPRQDGRRGGFRRRRLVVRSRKRKGKASKVGTVCFLQIKFACSVGFIA